jgi:hypothetical protein
MLEVGLNYVNSAEDMMQQRTGDVDIRHGAGHRVGDGLHAIAEQKEE